MRVDLGRELTDRRSVVAGQERVDPRHHAVPVEQQVERHHRHDDDEDDDVHEAHGGAQDRLDELGALGLQHRGEVLQRLAELGVGVQEIGEARRQPVLHVRHKFRHELEERDGLLHERGDHEEEEEHDREERQERDQRGGGRAGEAAALEPVGDGIEEVGDGRAEDEGQHHVGKQVEQHEEHRRGDAPVLELVPDRQRHGASFAYRFGMTERGSPRKRCAPSARAYERRGKRCANRRRARKRRGEGRRVARRRPAVTAKETCP